MGTQCENGHVNAVDPDTTNHCTDHYVKGHTGYYNMGDFCTLGGVGGKSHRKEWCGKLGDDEWGVEDTNGTGTCHYNDCKPYQVLGTGCCKGCCGIVGGGVRCTRQRFKGDPIPCCLQDKICKADPTPIGSDATGVPYAPRVCFSDPELKKTCNPCHRDVTTDLDDYGDSIVKTCREDGVTPCKEIVFDYCTGADLDDDDTSWMERWYDPVTGLEKENGCIGALKRNLYSNLGCAVYDVPHVVGTGNCETFEPGIPPSTEGVVWSRKVMREVFDKYRKNGYVIGSIPGTVGYNPFQEFLYETSCSFPVACQDGLADTCSVYTEQTLLYNPEAANWCGCYMADREYDKYTKEYRIKKECTPTCNRISAIPLVAGDGTPKVCTDTICIVNRTTIGLSKSTVGDGVNITQICGSCNGAGCTCIVEDNTVEGAGAEIGGGINLTEACSSTQCTVRNPGVDGPELLTVPCSEVTDPESDYNRQLMEYEKMEQKRQRLYGIIKLFIFLFFIVIIVLLFVYFKPLVSIPSDQDVVLTSPKRRTETMKNEKSTKTDKRDKQEGKRYSGFDLDVSERRFESRTVGTEGFRNSIRM